MTALVIGRDQLLLVAHDATATLGASNNAVNGLVECAVVDELGIRAGCQQRGLVEHVGQIGTRKAGGLARHNLEVDVGRHGLALSVHLKDLFATQQVGGVHAHLTVEATGAQQCRVEDVGAVGCRNKNDVRLGIKAVHLNQHLVQGLLAFVVTAAHSGATVTAHGIDLVDEDDGGSGLLGLLKKVTNSRRTDTNKHLDKIGTRDGEEGNARLAGYGTRQKSLSGSGRTVEQNALRNTRPDGLELGGLSQEVFDFAQFFNGLVDTGDIVKRDRGCFFRDESGLGLAELHDAVSAAAHRRQHEPEECADQNDGQHETECGEDPVLAGYVVVEAVGQGRVVDGLNNFLTARSDPVELNLLAELGVGRGELEINALVGVNDGGLGYLAAREHLEAHLGVNLLVAVHANEGGANPHGSNGHEDVDERSAKQLLEVHSAS